MFYRCMKAVLFDLDGVIIDSMGAHIDSWHDALQAFGMTAKKSELSTLGGFGPGPTIQRFAERKGIEITDGLVADIMRKKDARYAELSHRIFPEIPQILDFLKRKGIILAIVTGSSRKVAEAITENELPSYFEAIVGMEDVTRGKPAPEPYQKALEILGIEPTEAIVIEDSPLGIQSAVTAGIFAIGLETTLPAASLQEADLVLKDHKELLAYLKKAIKN